MEKINTLIIDDEKLAREITKRYLAKHENINIVGECQNGFEAVKAIAELKPDLIFLDIQMPKINGFELLELIDEPPAIIFSTAFDQYALKAFEVNAIDYLLKPFSQERFDAALEKAISRISYALNEQNDYSALKENYDEEIEYLNRIVVKKGSDIVIINVEKILYLEAQDDYVSIVTENGKFLKQKTMKYYEEKLPQENFIRIHRSNIINLNFMKKIEPMKKDNYAAVMQNNELLQISRSGYQKLKAFLE
ncbi:MAG: DNA-binding response regulator [Melioribacteraceae bacterium]|nr:MAG: DNA-binding response regulator [Melioribacteraceae bacterium]